MRETVADPQKQRERERDGDSSLGKLNKNSSKVMIGQNEILVRMRNESRKAS